VKRRNERYAEEIRESFGECAQLLAVARCRECGKFVGWLASVPATADSNRDWFSERTIARLVEKFPSADGRILLWHHVTPNFQTTEIDPDKSFQGFKPAELDPVQARVRTRALDDPAAGSSFLVDLFARGVGVLPLVYVGRADPVSRLSAWCRSHGERQTDVDWFWDLVQNGADEVRF
jgi:hypothetical protein